jgi:hypothetical protein
MSHGLNLRWVQALAGRSGMWGRDAYNSRQQPVVEPLALFFLEMSWTVR